MSDDVLYRMDGLVPSSGSSGSTASGSQNGFTGAWKLQGVQPPECQVFETMSCFIIEGNNLFLADGTCFSTMCRSEANTFKFKDSVLEIVADDLAWLRCAGSSGSACYHRVPLREHHFFGLYKALSSVIVPDLASTRRKLSQFKAHSGISVADTAQEVALSTCTGAVEMKCLRIAESRSLILVVYH